MRLGPSIARTVQRARYLILNMVRTGRYVLAAWIKPDDWRPGDPGHWWKSDTPPPPYKPGWHDPRCHGPYVVGPDILTQSSLDRAMRTPPSPIAPIPGPGGIHRTLPHKRCSDPWCWHGPDAHCILDDCGDDPRKPATLRCNPGVGGCHCGQADDPTPTPPETGRTHRHQC